MSSRWGEADEDMIFVDRKSIQFTKDIVKQIRTSTGEVQVRFKLLKSEENKLRSKICKQRQLCEEQVPEYRFKGLLKPCQGRRCS